MPERAGLAGVVADGVAGDGADLLCDGGDCNVVIAVLHRVRAVEWIDDQQGGADFLEEVHDASGVGEDQLPVFISLCQGDAAAGSL